MTKSQPYMKGKTNKAIVDALSAVLADTFMLYYKTHAFHWNVVGEHFRSLHLMFEEQYGELWQALDVIAERLRGLEGYAPVSLAELKKHARLQEAGQIPDAMGMVEQLAADNADIVATLYEAIARTNDGHDEATKDFLIDRVKSHEKAAWMLRSFAR